MPWFCVGKFAKSSLTGPFFPIYCWDHFFLHRSVGQSCVRCSSLTWQTCRNTLQHTKCRCGRVISPTTNTQKLLPAIHVFHDRALLELFTDGQNDVWKSPWLRMFSFELCTLPVLQPIHKGLSFVMVSFLTMNHFTITENTTRSPQMSPSHLQNIACINQYRPAGAHAGCGGLTHLLNGLRCKLSVSNFVVLHLHIFYSSAVCAKYPKYFTHALPSQCCFMIQYDLKGPSYCKTVHTYDRHVSLQPDLYEYLVPTE